MENAPFNFNFNCGVPDFPESLVRRAFATPTQNGFLLAAGFPIPTFDITLATDPTKYTQHSVNSF